MERDDPPAYTQVVGGAVGGLKRGDVSRIVANLLQECRDQEIKVMIRPERVGVRYEVEWRYVEFDRESKRWRPVSEFDRGRE